MLKLNIYMNKEKKTKFLKIACPRCGKGHILYGKGTTRIKCNGCNYLLVKPTGGKTKIKAKVKKILKK